MAVAPEHVVGRDDEPTTMAGLLAKTESLPWLLIVEVEPRIGKTTVWARGMQVCDRIVETVSCRD